MPRAAPDEYGGGPRRVTGDPGVEPTGGPHPLLPVLLGAAGGDFPPVDGQVTMFPPLERGLQAVVSLTGHAYVATSRPPSAFADLHLDGFGAAVHPATLQRLAGASGVIGVLNVLLAAAGTGGGRMPPRDDLDDHPRVQHARALRRDVRVHADDRGLVTLARSLADRTEISVEATAGRTGVGQGLIRDGLALATVGEVVFAAVAPGNARSLRTFLAAGFTLLGSEIIVISG